MDCLGINHPALDQQTLKTDLTSPGHMCMSMQTSLVSFGGLKDAIPAGSRVHPNFKGLTRALKGHDPRRRESSLTIRANVCMIVVYNNTE